MGAASWYSLQEPTAGPSLAPDLPPLPEAPAYDIRSPGEGQRFEYMMVQIPPTIVVTQSRGNDAAAYLEGIVNNHARKGRDFYRVDEIGVKVAPGCLAVLAGIRAETVSHYVVTFRRKIAT